MFPRWRSSLLQHVLCTSKMALCKNIFLSKEARNPSAEPPRFYNYPGKQHKPYGVQMQATRRSTTASETMLCPHVCS